MIPQKVETLLDRSNKSESLPFMHLFDEFVTYCKNFDFKIRRDHQKISDERHDYESVYEKSLS